MSDIVGLSVRAYRSIFLEDEWAHQKYYGWRVAEDLPGLRVLTKRRGVVKRTLMLLSPGGQKKLPQALARAAGRFGMGDIFIHDFSEVLITDPFIDAFGFRRATDGERLLNVATFVVDLANDEPSLLAAMSADYRRKIKKTEAAGIRVDAFDRPSDASSFSFVTRYNTFASERRISAIDLGVVRRMYAQGDAMLLVARRGQTVTGYLHIYMTGGIGFFMHGVNFEKSNEGSGQYLQWQAMRHLKMRGFGWYDLGGVSRLDPSNGIFSFKRKFGGQLKVLGSEWRHIGCTLRPFILLSTISRIAKK